MRSDPARSTNVSRPRVIVLVTLSCPSTVRTKRRWDLELWWRRGGGVSGWGWWGSGVSGGGDSGVSGGGMVG